MISPHAKLDIQVLPISSLVVTHVEPRYLERLMHYVGLLVRYPTDYAGILHVIPVAAHPGLFSVSDGHTRYCAYILAGRKDALCLIVDEPPEKGTSHAHA